MYIAMITGHSILAGRIII